MDKHFLEFWGNYLLGMARSREQFDNAAQFFRRSLELWGSPREEGAGKEHPDEISRWIKIGAAHFQAQMDLFRKIYGLEGNPEEGSANPAEWNRAAENFRKSFREFFELLGVVPREDYDRLRLNCEELKKKFAEQEETIRRLKKTRAEKGPDPEQTMQAFEDLILKQGKQFQDIMDSFGKMYSKRD